MTLLGPAIEWAVVAIELGGHRFPEGVYVEAFDHEAKGGRGVATFTTEVVKAMRFETKEAALEFWNKQSETVPIRPYGPPGRPNKPMTAITVEIVEVPRA